MIKRMLLPAALLLCCLCLLPVWAAGAEEVALLNQEEKLFIWKEYDNSSMYSLAYVNRLEADIPEDMMYAIQHRLALLDSAGNVLTTIDSKSSRTSSYLLERGEVITVEYIYSEKLEPALRDQIADYRLEATVEEKIELYPGRLRGGYDSHKIQMPIGHVSVVEGDYGYLNVVGTFFNPLDHAIIPKNVGGFHADYWLYNENNELVYYGWELMDMSTTKSFEAHGEDRFSIMVPGRGIQSVIGTDLRVEMSISFYDDSDQRYTVPTVDPTSSVSLLNENLYVYAREDYDFYTCDYSAQLRNEGNEALQITLNVYLMDDQRGRLAGIGMDPYVSILLPGQTASVQGTGNIERGRLAELADYEAHITAKPVEGYRGYTTIPASVSFERNGGEGITATIQMTNTLDHPVQWDDLAMNIRLYDQAGNLLYTRRQEKYSMNLRNVTQPKQGNRFDAWFFREQVAAIEQNGAVDRIEAEFVWYDHD
ncbi:MAG: hypothetical protein IJ240_00975 [Clostridia bacterium]|nr:hypothetical protein [Clostridia bacterium]